VLAIIRKEPLVFAPGTQNGYSNSGMFVVGAIVEQVSGQSYYNYVREHVFKRPAWRRIELAGRVTTSR